MKSAHVYEYNGNWYFRPYSQTTAGVWVGMDSIAKLDAAAPDAEKGQIAIHILEESSESLPHPTDWGDLDNDSLLRTAGAKSWAAFMKSAKCLAVDLENRQLKIVPRKNLGPKDGYESMPEESVKIPLDSPPQHIGIALEDGLSRCR